MKLRDAKCELCGKVCEVLVENSVISEDLLGDEYRCEECGGNMRVLPCSPSVRTPMNSASYVDGTCDYQRKTNFACEREACKLDAEMLKHAPGSLEREAVKAEAAKVREGIKAERVLG